MNAITGAKNLLLNCAEAQPGERLLVVHESTDLGYYYPCATNCVMAAAKKMDWQRRHSMLGFHPITRIYHPP